MKKLWTICGIALSTSVLMSPPNPVDEIIKQAQQEQENQTNRLLTTRGISFTQSNASSYLGAMRKALELSDLSERKRAAQHIALSAVNSIATDHSAVVREIMKLYEQHFPDTPLGSSIVKRMVDTSAIKGLQAQQSSLQDTVTRLQGEIRQRTPEAKRLRDEVDQLTAERDALIAEITTATTELDVLHDTLATTTTSITRSVGR